MVRRIISFVLFTTAFCNSNAQKKGLSAGFGISHYLGDIGNVTQKANGFSNYQWKTSGKYFVISYNKDVSDFLSFRLFSGFTNLQGADSLIKDPHGKGQDRFLRNLSFKTSVVEVGGVLELHPLSRAFTTFSEKIKPYFAIGGGVIYFNPWTSDYSGSRVFLHPLRTEGQGFDEYPGIKKYHLIQPILIYSTGIKVKASSQIELTFEASYRKTFTDYLDDVSTIYVDPVVFRKYLNPTQAAVATRLYYRGNYPGINSQILKDNYIRGDKNDKDVYVGVIFRVGYWFNSKNQFECPKNIY